MGAERGKSEGVIGANKDALETSREDARVLLWFATRAGKKVEPKVLESIVTADSDLTIKPRSSDNEAKFWTAYRDLAAAVRPACVESILSSCKHPFREHGQTDNWKLGNARATKSRYTLFALGVMFALILFQTYWFVVTAFSANLEKHRDELDTIAGSLRLMNVLAEEMTQVPQVSGWEEVKQTQNGSHNLHAATPVQESPDEPQEETQRFNENPQLLDLIKTVIQGLLANNPMLAALVLTRDPTVQLMSIGCLDLENKRYRTQRLIAMIENEKTILKEPWMVLWYLVRPPISPTSQADDEDINENQTECARGQFHDDLKDEQLQIERIIADKNLEQILSQSQSIPSILSQYVLPMLYGLLGALTYILRTLTMEIREVTFIRASADRYSLRWPLGMLAGVTVSLFFDPSKFIGLAAITPLAIAFLAGYGVELFFTALDGLVRTFTRDGSERPKAGEAA